jgi:hypothetical protein
MKVPPGAEDSGWSRLAVYFLPNSITDAVE